LSPLPSRPTAPLFPYTTLFRSERPRHGALAERRHREALELERRVRRHERIDGVHALHRGAERRRRHRRALESDLFSHAPDEDHLDRKSTRLNSSHEWISYAVFC